MPSDQLIDLLRRELAATNDAGERAIFLAKLTREVYDYVKFQQPEGGGFEGAGGPERTALAKVLDVVLEHDLTIPLEVIDPDDPDRPDGLSA